MNFVGQLCSMTDPDDRSTQRVKGKAIFLYVPLVGHSNRALKAIPSNSHLLCCSSLGRKCSHREYHDRDTPVALEPCLLTLPSSEISKFIKLHWGWSCSRPCCDPGMTSRAAVTLSWYIDHVSASLASILPSFVSEGSLYFLLNFFVERVSSWSASNARTGRIYDLMRAEFWSI